MKFAKSSLQSVGDILIKFNPLEDKYISREFQAYGYYLTEKLNDFKHKSLYMRLAKTLPRAVLEKALSYVSDAKFKRKGALFMWKLKQMGAWDKNLKSQSSNVKNKKNPATLLGARKKVEDIPF